MVIRNKRTGKKVHLDMVAFAVVVVMGCALFKPALVLMMNVYLAMNGGR